MICVEHMRHRVRKDQVVSGCSVIEPCCSSCKRDFGLFVAIKGRRGMKRDTIPYQLRSSVIQTLFSGERTRRISPFHFKAILPGKIVRQTEVRLSLANGAKRGCSSTSERVIQFRSNYVLSRCADKVFTFDSSRIPHDGVRIWKLESALRSGKQGESAESEKQSRNPG
jgi:hypothetical protein